VVIFLKGLPKGKGPRQKQIRDAKLASRNGNSPDVRQRGKGLDIPMGIIGENQGRNVPAGSVGGKQAPLKKNEGRRRIVDGLERLTSCSYYWKRFLNKDGGE